MTIGWTSAILAVFGAVVGTAFLSRFSLSRSLRQELGVAARPNAALSFRAMAVPLLQPKLRRSLVPVRLEVAYVPLTILLPVGFLIADALMGEDLDSFGFAHLLWLTGLAGAGLLTTILLGRFGKTANLAVAAYAHGLAIYRPLNGAFLAWKDVQTIFVDPPQGGGFLQSDAPASLHIFAEDGQEWRFGMDELGAGADEMAEFAEFALAQAYSPAAMRRR